MRPISTLSLVRVLVCTATRPTHRTANHRAVTVPTCSQNVPFVLLSATMTVRESVVHDRVNLVLLVSTNPSTRSTGYGTQLTAMVRPLFSETTTPLVLRKLNV
ncbi:hypothetical protein EDB89DRAFT_1955031 [Lactarius sanguifluus]|nr:hypothetical protein EDB89DRAFT_1955031 [Lactarius sanguifluus]